MDWYIPITILPGVGLLLTSTSNIVNGLSQELSELIKDDCSLMRTVIIRKINQLGLINRSMVAMYLTAASYVLAGLIGGIAESLLFNVNFYMLLLMLIGTISILCALFLLVLYSYRAVKIKKLQFEKNL